GSPCVEHVVHQHNALALGGRQSVAGSRRLDTGHSPVISVRSGVQFIHRHVGSLELLDEGGYAPCEGRASRVYSDQLQVLGATVALQYLVGDASEGTSDRFFIEYGSSLLCTAHV